MISFVLDLRHTSKKQMSNMWVRITMHLVFCNVVFAFKLVGLLTVAAYIAAFSSLFLTLILSL